jgi:tol-pal system protein YbgF
MFVWTFRALGMEMIRKDRFAGRGALLGATAIVLCAIIPAAAQSGDPSSDNLARRLAAAQSEAEHLSAETQSLSAKADGTQVAQLFGESDEEKAARLQHEQAQDSSLATLNQRANELDDTLRRLTGQIEELDHRISEQNERIARMKKDFDYKICSMVAQQFGATTEQGEESSLPCAGQGQQQSTAVPQPSGQGNGQGPNGSIHLAPPPGVLGTLPRNDMGNLPQPSTTAPNQMASLDARPQFETALNLLAKAQYDEASAAFRNFADTYPNDDLAAQAVYWVGDIAYVQRDYTGAARAFAEELKKYPTGTRAPESMLKLGQSLLALNQKKEGCRALGTLPIQFPSASKSVTDQALAARKTAGCR